MNSILFFLVIFVILYLIDYFNPKFSKNPKINTCAIIALKSLIIIAFIVPKSTQDRSMFAVAAYFITIIAICLSIFYTLIKDKKNRKE